MKSPMLLWKELALELGQWCRVCTTRDVQTVTRRFEEEGLSFLTITLPTFAVDFERGLADGRVAPTSFQGFKKRGGLPLLLGGFLELVFDRKTGVLLEHVSVDAIYAVRQLTRLYSKIFLPCSQERERKAFDGYVQVESELKAAEREWTPEDLRAFSRIARLLFGRVLSSADVLCASGELVPRHGKGTTAEKLLGNQKFYSTEWTQRLESAGFHADSYLIPNHRYVQYLSVLEFLDPGAERPSRVISVPKTLKTPRIIAAEPVCMQYTQQAIAKPLVELLENDCISKWFVGFTDQVPNQALARVGSVDGGLATLDLSEASDRVSNRLVEILLHGFTNLSEMVQASRSLRADVPRHGVIPLTKFASMGSALTFPMEAMVFCTVAFLGIESCLGSKLTEKGIKSLIGQVRVYGDDIVVPAQYAVSVSSALEAFGFKVNSRKSFWTGKFRESCGKDYYAGQDVTTVKVRRVTPTTLNDVEEIVSMVSLRNQLHHRGFVSSVAALDHYLVKLLKHFPKVAENSPLLGRHSVEMTIDKMCPRTHKPLARGYVVKDRLPINSVDGPQALLKIFLKNFEKDDLPVVGFDHLERSGRPSGVALKLTMADPYERVSGREAKW